MYVYRAYFINFLFPFYLLGGLGDPLGGVWFGLLGYPLGSGLLGFGVLGTDGLGGFCGLCGCFDILN